MSVISTAYDQMISRLGTLFPVTSATYQRLSNPYDLESNASTMLDQGWGLAIGPGSNSNRNLCSVVTTVRTMNVVLTRCADAGENDDTTRDGVVKALLEDARSVVNDFERNVRLDTSDTNCRFVSDGGVESFGGSEGSMYYAIRLTFEAEIFDAP